MRILLFLQVALCSFILQAFGQDVSYLDKEGNRMSSLVLDGYYEVVLDDQTDTSKVTDKIYDDASTQLRSESHFSNFQHRTLDGTLKQYDQKGYYGKI